MENITINQAVILAGGMGTRMKPYTDNHPKPMYPFGGKPFIEYLIRQIKSFGIENVLILLGYMPEEVMEYLKDGSEYGVNICYNITPIDYNTGDRLIYAQKLIEEHFLLMYCDNYCPINFGQLVRDFESNHALIQLSAYENKDNYTKSNLLICDGLVRAYDKKRITSDLQGVDIGYAVINKSVFQYMSGENINFEEIVYPEIVRQRKLFADRKSTRLNSSHS